MNVGAGQAVVDLSRVAGDQPVTPAVPVSAEQHLIQLLMRKQRQQQQPQQQQQQQALLQLLMQSQVGAVVVLVTHHVSRNHAKFLLNSAVKHWPILKIFAMQLREETFRKCS